MWKQSFLKYRGLFISTTAFVFFFILYLLVNYTFQNKTINDIRYSDVIQKTYSKMNDEGLTEALLRDINTIKVGGIIKLSSNDQVTLVPIAKQLPSAELTADELLAAIDVNDESLAAERMSEISLLAIAKKERSTKLLNTLQVIAAILTALLYFMVIVQLVLQLSKGDVVEVQSRKETEGIMSTISEGIFLLNSRYDIGSEQSASLRGMFKSEKELEGHFLDFISAYVTQKNVELAQEYLELLFGDRVKEKLVEELNPLKEVEVNIVRRDGSFESIYLDFKFKRVLVEGKVSHLLGSVNNVTKQVLLERELNETKEAQVAQLDMLKSILHIDRNKLGLFFNTTDSILHEVNDSLEAQGKGFSDGDIRRLLTTISSKIHQIKGDAAILGLHRFEFAAHDLEDSISAIKTEHKTITGKDLFPLTTNLRMMFSDLEDLKELVNKFSGIQTVSSDQHVIDTNHGSDLSTDDIEEEDAQVPNSPESYHADNIDIDSSLQQLVKTVSERNNKNIKLITSGLSGETIPKPLVNTIQTIATQCVRNSIVHGIESPESRLDAGKPEYGTITIHFAETSLGHILKIRDDGAGIDEAALLQKAIDKSILTPEKAADLAQGKIKALLFHSGFSTQNEAGMDAGRGVGLDVIKRLVDEQQAKMNISYKKGEHYQFGVLFPQAQT